MTSPDLYTLDRLLDGSLPAEERLETLLPHTPDSSELLVACAPGDFSASHIAKAVEDCDAQLLTLSVTGITDQRGRLLVLLKVNRRNVAAIDASLNRYGMEVAHVLDADPAADLTSARQRVNELLHYLEI